MKTSNEIDVISDLNIFSCKGLPYDTCKTHRTACHFDQLWGAGFATRIDFVSENGRQAHPRSDDQIVFFQIWGIVLGLFNLIELAPDQTRDADQLDTGAMSLAQCFASTKQAG